MNNKFYALVSSLLKDKDDSMGEKEKEIEIETENKEKLPIPMNSPESLILLVAPVAYYLQKKGRLNDSFSLFNELISRPTENSNLSKKGELLRIVNTSFDQVMAFIYFNFALVSEKNDNLNEIKDELFEAYSIAARRHMDETKITILNILLRNYLARNEHEQAAMLVARTGIKEETASSVQMARYLYYDGLIKAIRLSYTESSQQLQHAIRKAPASALGFHLSVSKLLCLVQLLLGEIPERSLFSQKGLIAALKPYLQLTQAVIIGDLEYFHKVVSQNVEIFRKDKTLTLIQRLRHNVIKAGLRKITQTYSRIAISDIAKKLRLDNPVDCEFIVAKAIRDGVIDATIDHENSFLQSKENFDVYATNEPQAQFNERIHFCFKIHNDAVKSMKYHEDDTKKHGTEEIIQLEDEDDDEDMLDDD